MKEFLDLVRLARELGLRWLPTTVGVILISLLIWLRRSQVANAAEFVRDPSLWAIAFAACAAQLIVRHYYGLGLPFLPAQIGILVASIPSDQHHAQQNAYVEAVRGLVANDPGLSGVVVVRPIDRVLPNDPEEQHLEALRLGRRRGASFVIRPVLVEGGHSPWISVVDQPGFRREEAPLGRVTQAQLQELDKLPLPPDVALLARCALALAYYRREVYEPVAHHLTQILAAPELPAAAPERAHLNFVLGNSYWYLRPTDPASLLLQAIAAYDAALAEWSPNRYPTEWATTMNNRGTAYGELPGPDRAANLREAIRCYDEALKVYTRDRYPTDWAMSMNNRGNAYGELPGPDRDANLREAIRCFDEALKQYTRDRYPTDWAMTMNNRGNAYGELPGPDREANLGEAIRCFDEALKEYTRDRYPTQWATTMNNRGNAYAELPGPDPAANLREAIRCYDEALTVYTRDRYPTQWAMTMSNRGNACRKFPGPDRAASLLEAIRCYDEALKVNTRDRYPTQWAMTMNNRGNAYRELPGPDRAASLLEAIRCYQMALEELEKQGMTHYAQITRQNLEGALREHAELAVTAK